MENNSLKKRYDKLDANLVCQKSFHCNLIQLIQVLFYKKPVYKKLEAGAP